MPDRPGRREPYTDAGVRRLKCVRCGQPAVHQWQTCADDNLWRPICKQCDVALNHLALTFMKDPDAEAKIAKYREAMNA